MWLMTIAGTIFHGSVFTILSGLYIYTLPDDDRFSDGGTTESENDRIAWMDMETAVAANKQNPKPFFIDMYTTWCGWCTKMDVATFSDPDVIQYINQNFHPVKFDAETDEPVMYKGRSYEKKHYPQFKQSYNELAVSLMDSKMSFPTFVILSRKEVKLGSIQGYQVPEVLIARTKAIAKL
jgi:thioredoxin-related protein